MKKYDGMGMRVTETERASVMGILDSTMEVCHLSG